MEPPTSLLDSASCLVCDASTVINLNATSEARAILRAVSRRVVVLDMVQAELEQGRAKGRRDADQLRELVSADLVHIVSLGTHGSTLFETLVIGPASDTLDDGEAATIAYALEAGALALIDEHKANRLCERRFPTLRLGCTVDLFAHPLVGGALGRDALKRAVVSALRVARMQVVARHIDWVVDLIGLEQVAMCRSLPPAARTTRVTTRK